MEGKIRRVVTGHDEEGNAIVVSDGFAPAHPNPLRPGRIANEIRRTSAMPVPPTREEPDPVAGPRQLQPAANGTVFRIILDKEEVKLKTGDVVIQRGTSHAWSNRSGKPVKMLYVLIDGAFEPGLAQQFGGH